VNAKWGGLATVLLFYGIAYSFLIWLGGGIPYVLDNNESFSSLWHAANMHNYPFAISYGLTDESYGTSIASHPYVYTHQGNFPRLFAYLIYLLGARSIESQIVVTTFTVGAAAISLAYLFFARVGSTLFAILCCAVLLSDYLLVAQWQIVTYRVWHEFFVFSSLLSVYLVGRASLRWLAVVNFLCLFYYEFVFVSFVALSCLLFALHVHWGKWRHVLEFVLLMAVGGFLALSMLAIQLVAYLGWADFLRDAYLTFVARNRFRTDPSLLQQMMEFFDSRNIAFWYNLEDGGRFRSFSYFIASLTYYELQIHTPFFTTLTAIILVSIIVGYVAHHSDIDWTRAGIVRVANKADYGTVIAIGLLVAHLAHKAYRDSLGIVQLGPMAVIGLLFLVVHRMRVKTFQALRRRPLHDLTALGLCSLLPSVLLHRSSEPLVAGLYSPIYLVFLFVYCATLVALISERLWPIRRWKIAMSAKSYFRDLSSVASVALVAGAVFLITLSIRQPWRLTGMKAADRSSEFLIDLQYGIAAACGGMLCALLWNRRVMRNEGVVQTQAHRYYESIWLTSFLVIASFFSFLSPALYHQAYGPLWSAIADELDFGRWMGLGLVLAIVVGMRISSVLPTRYLRLEGNRGAKALVAFFASGFIAYCATYLVFPAYMYTGYRFRLTPFTVFHTDALIALALLAILGITRDAFHNAVRGARVPAAGLSLVVGVGACGLAVLMTLYWFGTQYVYLRMFPPDHYSVLTLLAQKYKNASTITNTYAAPIAWATKSWSYLHPGTIDASWLARDGSRLVVAPEGTYMWFADKRSNPAYRRPEYYVCITVASTLHVVQNLRWKSGLGSRFLGCEDDFLVRSARSGLGDMCPPLKLSDVDKEGVETIGYARWAIVKLDWTEADSRCNEFVDRTMIRPLVR
jgi:hypothetical protein